jgi:saccharopine dehydrogenase-like NADP-dependent oxidoreductase
MDNRIVLLLGATGVFGRRLAANLACVDGIALVLTSRQLNKAQELVNSIQLKHPHASVTARVVERKNLTVALSEIKPWAVIDASGPFQGLDYSLPKQALAAGCHFLDLADARDYLHGFVSALNDDAMARGLLALAGVSSSPALSSAVVAALTEGWQRIDTIDMAITPDGVGDVGEAVVLGVLSYAGDKVRQFRYGALRHVKAWMRGHVIDVPNLGLRWVAPVETSEADLLPSAFKVHSRVTFYAGLESRLEMAGIATLARLRALGFVQNLKPLVWPFVMGRKLTRLTGGDHGGMMVRVAGLNGQQQWTEATWSLLARNGQGLNVPGLPIVAAIRMLLRHQLPPGARVACGDVPLQQIEAEFEAYPITTQQRVVTPGKGIFDDALSSAEMAALPKPIVDFHQGAISPVWQGQAHISRSNGFVPDIVGWLIGLPKAGDAVPVRVTVEREGDGTERWTRMFDGNAFHSVMNRGPDNSFWEKFGPLNFKLKLRVENGRLLYPITQARAWGMPMPQFLLPHTDAFETVDEKGRFVFDVRITLPVGGMLVHYRGWLEAVRP